MGFCWHSPCWALEAAIFWLVHTMAVYSPIALIASQVRLLDHSAEFQESRSSRSWFSHSCAAEEALGIRHPRLRRFLPFRSKIPCGAPSLSWLRVGGTFSQFPARVLGLKMQASGHSLSFHRRPLDKDVSMCTSGQPSPRMIRNFDSSLADFPESIFGAVISWVDSLLEAAFAFETAFES